MSSFVANEKLWKNYFLTFCLSVRHWNSFNLKAPPFFYKGLFGQELQKGARERWPSTDWKLGRALSGKLHKRKI